MTEIKISAAAPASGSPRPVQAAELVLRLSQPLQGLLVMGETAEAEVVGIREEARSFQLLLRTTLQDGRLATLQASSTKPVALGAAFSITALAENRLLASLQPAHQQPLESLDLDLLPIGTQVQAKVVATQQIAQQSTDNTVFKVLVNLLDGALAGRKLLLESDHALPVGTLLTARVQGDQALALIPLSARLDQLAVTQQLGSQFARQGSLEGLFKALQGAIDGELPDGVRGSVDKLLGALPQISQLTDPKAIAQLLARSGVFLESGLLSGQSATSQDLKADLLRLIAQLVPNLPGGSPLAAAQAASTTQALPALLRQAIGNLAPSSQRQAALSFPLSSRQLQGLDEEPGLETLLKLAASALARLQTHQLSSLAQTQVGPDGNLVTTWQLEVPMRDQRDIVPLQIKLQRETEQEGRKPAEKAQTLWRVDLAFDLDPLGPLQVQAQLLDGSLSSQLWAERPETARLIAAELDHLRNRLTEAGMTVGELACRQGTPPQGPRTAVQQRFVDEKA